MALTEFKTGSFDKSTSTSTPVSQGVAGIGFTPKALILFATLTTTQDSSTPDYYVAVGITDGTDVRSGYTHCDDQRGTMVSKRRSTASKFLRFHNASSDTLLAECDLTSLDSDGFTLSWTTNDAVAVKIKYIAFGGSNLTADVFEFTSKTTTGSQSVATALNTADFVFLMSATMTAHDTQGGWGFFQLGMATGPSNEGCLCSVTAGSGTSQNSHRAQRTNAIVTLQNSITGNLQRADFTNFTSTGFDINWTTVNGAAYIHMGLTIKGGEWEVGNGTTNTSSANKAYTTAFKPAGVMAMSFGRAASSAVGVNHGHIMFGASSSGTDDQGIATVDEDAALTSDDYMWSSSTHMLHMLNTANGTTLDRAQLDSFNALDFTLNYGTADGTAREFIWAVLKEDVAAGGGRIMSSLANSGGLAGMGGIAGYGGGLAG